MGAPVAEIAPAPPASRPGRVEAWIHAARIPTLAAAVVPVLVGSALAAREHAFRFGPALAALLGALLIQLGTNFVNDLGDFRRGADARGRLGPPRALAVGWLSVSEIQMAIALSFGAAMIAGLYLTSVAGWPVIAIGVASMLAGAAYTTGPFPLAYHALGELFVLLFFGVVAVCGTYFVQAGRVSEVAMIASVPVGALASAILVVNNVRDRETDRAAGKRTLSVLLGPRHARLEYPALLVLAYGTPVALILTGAVEWPVLLPWLTAPLAIREARRVLGAQGPALNRSLVGTARLHVLFGLLFAGGMLFA